MWFCFRPPRSVVIPWYQNQTSILQEKKTRACPWKLFNYFSYCCDWIPDKEQFKRGEVSFGSQLEWTCNSSSWILSFPMLPSFCMTSLIMLPACGVFLVSVSHLSSLTWVTWSYFLVPLLLAFVVGLGVPSCALSQHLDPLSFAGSITLPLCGCVKHAWDLLSGLSIAWIRKWTSSKAVVLVGVMPTVSVLLCCECDFWPSVLGLYVSISVILSKMSFYHLLRLISLCF